MKARRARVEVEHCRPGAIERRNGIGAAVRTAAREAVCVRAARVLRAAGDVWPEEGRDGANATGAHRPRCDERGADRSAAGAIEVEGCSAESRKQIVDSG
ncbi:hypothetical protein DP42_5276 [Burkholderia pseudomallei]|nr:hypothetical protein DO73_4949 [Burkholderia pseudomallei]KGD12079.1 hypothetical protein DP42_5276 [Burkholderia pseudomallei]